MGHAERRARSGPGRGAVHARHRSACRRLGPSLGVTVILSIVISLSGCRRAAFALLPQAPMGPQRNADPFAPLGPPAASRAPESQAATISTAAGKVDAGVSAASLLANFLGGSALLFGLYGNFEETAVVAPDRDPARKRAAPPPTTNSAPPAPPLPEAPAAPDE